jgi:hypothetical protein
LRRTVSALLRTIVLEPAVWTPFPSGNDVGVLSRAAAGKLQADGFEPGWPDYLVLFNGKVVGIELKREGGVLSAAQKAMHPRLYRAGCPVYVCRTPEEVVEYLNIERVPLRQNFVEAILRNKETVHAIDKGAAEGGKAQSEAR